MAWGLSLLGAGFLYLILSPTGLVFKLTNFLSSPSYIIIQHPPSPCGRHNFALLQPVHGQGYNILIIPRPDAPVIYTGAFPILTARPGRRSICNIYWDHQMIKKTVENITKLKTQSKEKVLRTCFLETQINQSEYWQNNHFWQILRYLKRFELRELRRCRILGEFGSVKKSPWQLPLTKIF